MNWMLNAQCCSMLASSLIGSAGGGGWGSGIMSPVLCRTKSQPITDTRVMSKFTVRPSPVAPRLEPFFLCMKTARVAACCLLSLSSRFSHRQLSIKRTGNRNQCHLIIYCPVQIRKVRYDKNELRSTVQGVHRHHSTLLSVEKSLLLHSIHFVCTCMRVTNNNS